MFSSINTTKKIKQHHKSNKLNFTSEISSRIERLEHQKINDNEIHELLKQEILLKIENERELFKRRKIETIIAENNLIFQQEKQKSELKVETTNLNQKFL